MKARILAATTAAVLAAGTLSGCFGASDDCDALPAGTSVAQSVTGVGVVTSKKKPKKATKPKKKKKNTGGHVDTDECDDD